MGPQLFRQLFNNDGGGQEVLGNVFVSGAVDFVYENERQRAVFTGRFQHGGENLAVTGTDFTTSFDYANNHVDTRRRCSGRAVHTAAERRLRAVNTRCVDEDDLHFALSPDAPDLITSGVWRRRGDGNLGAHNGV